MTATLPTEFHLRFNGSNGRGAGRQLTGLNGRYLMSYPPFKHIDFWKPLQPLLAGCTRCYFKHEWPESVEEEPFRLKK